MCAKPSAESQENSESKAFAELRFIILEFTFTDSKTIKIQTGQILKYTQIVSESKQFI
ncbi:hypothetical protein [uncultured Helicobacter sp.]|uniref:hypothetical protein n=1 Tax=uncultured Helicobacter sp. TaxID=175537 RepID=UPI003751DCD9